MTADIIMALCMLGFIQSDNDVDTKSFEDFYVIRYNIESPTAGQIWNQGT